MGNIIGPQFFLTSQAPHYNLGIGMMLSAFVIMAVTGVVYFILCIVENKRRDATYGKQRDTLRAGLEVEESDLTDRKNHNFRYIY